MTGTPKRFSVQLAMIIVAIIAIDIAAVRLVFGSAMTYGFGLLAMISTIPIGLILNMAILFLYQGRKRAFWTGFLVCGIPMMISSAWAALTPAGTRVTAGRPPVVMEGSGYGTSGRNISSSWWIV